MAYVADDEEEQQQQGQPAQQGAEKVLSSGSATISGGSPQGAAPAAPATPAATNSGGGWTNLSRYVQANEGQDSRMGEAVKGKYDETAETARTGTETWGTAAAGAVESGTVREGGVVDQLNMFGAPQPSQPPTRAATGGAPAGGGRAPEPRPANAQAPQNPPAARAPVQTTPPQAPMETLFETQLQGYQGPENAWNVEGFGDAERGVTGAVEQAGRAQDFEGRRTLLNDIYGQNGRYNAGEQRLDSFLVGGGAGGQQALGAIDQSGKQLKGGWEELVNRVGGDIGTARATSDQTKADTLAAFEAAQARLGGRLEGLSADAAKKNTENSARLTGLVGGLSSKDPAAQQKAVADVAKLTGADPKVVQRMLEWGVDPAKIIQSAGQVSLGDLAGGADAAQWAQLGKLGKLAGREDPLKEYDFTGGADLDGIKADDEFLGKGAEAAALYDRLNGQTDRSDADLQSWRELMDYLGGNGALGEAPLPSVGSIRKPKAPKVTASSLMKGKDTANAKYTSNGKEVSKEEYEAARAAFEKEDRKKRPWAYED